MKKFVVEMAVGFCASLTVILSNNFRPPHLL